MVRKTQVQIERDFVAEINAALENDKKTITYFDIINLKSRLVAEEMEKIRLEIGVSRREYAYMLGVSYDAIRNWNRRRTAVSAPVAILAQLIQLVCIPKEKEKVQ